VRFDGDDIWWVEQRLTENRYAIVRRSAGEASVLPEPYSARTRVHEYGGGAWTVSDGTLYFSNDQNRGPDEKPDRRLYRLDRGASAPSPITPLGPPEIEWRFADGIIDRLRDRWIGIREEHTSDAAKGAVGHPENTIVAVDVNSSGSDSGTIVVKGHDFFSSPRLSPDGSRLAWLAWDHPSMPWTSAILYLAELGVNGLPRTQPIRVAGGATESVFQPEWSPDGSALFFVSDRTGWWNLYRYDLAARSVTPLAKKSAEFGQAQWQFGMSTYSAAIPNRIVASYTSGGLGRLAVIDLKTGKLTDLDLPFTDFSSVRADGRDRVVFRAGAADKPASIVFLQLSSGRYEILKQSNDIVDDPRVSRCISRATSVQFPTKGGKTSYGLYYKPFNPGYAAPAGERPPLLVRCHGGPTSAASSTLNLGIQYWTSRGIAVLDVNYGGSTGYGREYRDRLHLRWGIVDVDDCVNGAKYLATIGKVDKRRTVISGGSAGGFTALAALTFRKYFSGGASHYGISDIAALARDTHKFEARYLDWLIGEYPVEKAKYRARSPLFHASRLSKPVAFFQGEQDPVVPPSQTEKMVEALRRKGISVGYMLFSGEQHGFRQASNIQHALDAELYFYSVEVFRVKLSY
jgi:dipeptidyl aminopeptidase/acylaminoacyl peptidase